MRRPQPGNRATMTENAPEEHRSDAEQAGIVDQQDAALTAMAAAETDEAETDDAEPGAPHPPDRAPAEGGTDEVDEPPASS